MQDQPSQVLGEGGPRVERVVILQLLRDDHGDRWSRAALEVEIANVEPLDITDALARLDQEGIVQISGDSVSASRAVRRLDELELIAI
ncbi:MAG TPA: hypothetical protein VKG38_14405 [Solirubrobacteraceae bacterium]|nr:hypothetical protein [Solirubrobacteraceae bacterium]